MDLSLTANLTAMFTFYDNLFSTVSRYLAINLQLYCITGTFGVLLNLLLLILIFTCSPPSLSVYRVLLTNVAITDLVFAGTVLFGQIRIIPDKWVFAYISLGPARLFGPNIAYLTYSVQLHSIFYTFLSFPLSFGFRYYVLVKPTPRVRTLVFICLALWSLALVQHLLFDLSQSNPDFIREYLQENRPEYNLTGYIVSGNHMLREPLTSITLATIVIPMFPIYVIVVYYRQKVQEYLRKSSDESSQTSLSEGTIRGHRRLIKAALPLFFFFPPITIYLLYHLEIIDFTIIEYLVFVLFSFFPMTSPAVTMYFVRPYRTAVVGMLHCQCIVSRIGSNQQPCRAAFTTTTTHQGSPQSTVP